MPGLHPKFITDKKGKKTAVILPLSEFNLLMEELEDLEDIRRYDEAKAAGEVSIPVDEAFKLIEAKRR